ncbi:hypothetical protein ACFL2C_02325 [Patescibacteria group bacterium]
MPFHFKPCIGKEPYTPGHVGSVYKSTPGVRAQERLTGDDGYMTLEHAEREYPGITVTRYDPSICPDCRKITHSEVRLSRERTG